MLYVLRSGHTNGVAFYDAVEINNKKFDTESKEAIYEEHMKKQTQYRISFTELDNVNGDMRRVNYSTKWMDSLDEIKKSRWLKCDDAKIVAREFAKEGMLAMAA